MHKHFNIFSGTKVNSHSLKLNMYMYVNMLENHCQVKYLKTSYIVGHYLLDEKIYAHK